MIDFYIQENMFASLYVSCMFASLYINWQTWSIHIICSAFLDSDNFSYINNTYSLELGNIGISTAPCCGVNTCVLHKHSLLIHI